MSAIYSQTSQSFEGGRDSANMSPFLQPPDQPFVRPDPSLASRGSEAYSYDSPAAQGSAANLHSNASPLLGGQQAIPKERYADEVPLYDPDAKRPLYKRPLFWVIAAAAVVVVVVAVVVPVYFTVIKPNQDQDNASGASGASGGSGSGGGGKGSKATSGGDGSTVTTEDGSTFTYSNAFGGFWVQDPSNPYDNSAQPNSWTPPLNTSWTWGVDRIYGVNIGGLFVLEPFIVPDLYQTYNGSVDEWTLSTLIAQSAGGGDAGQKKLQEVLEDHYNTFITEQDLAEIASAGLNWIRLPIPFWAIESWADVGIDGTTGQHVGEPFLARVCWKYILRLLGWARKYGLRVYLDLHTVPGSQNGYNHSGKMGQINFLNGVMGIANAARTLDYIRILTEFFAQPEYQDLVPIFGIVNEVFVKGVGKDQITSFYLHSHDMIRNITGVGEDHGPYIAIHDGFLGVGTWADFLPGSDRILLDTHPYFAFDGQPNNEPLNIPAVGGDGSFLGGIWPQRACNAWGPSINKSREQFGVTIAGEFSNAFSDCGLFVNGVLGGHSSAADCDFWSDASQWDDNNKNGLMNFAMASMDALGDWFFWTWKIGNSTAGRVQSPLWSYQLGLEGGWIPKDPRTALGRCASVGVSSPFDGTFQPWQTGGAGAGTIAPSATEEFGTYPPTLLSNVPLPSMSLLPTYTPTQAIITLPPPTFTPAPPKGFSTGDGWFDNQDTSSIVTAVSGCSYPFAWSALSSPVPTALCGSGGVLSVPTPIVTNPVVPPAPVTAAPGAATTTGATTTSVPGQPPV